MKTRGERRITSSIVLPQKVVDQAFALDEQFGMFELTWLLEDLAIVFNALENNVCVILGGDVYKIENGRAIIT